MVESAREIMGIEHTTIILWNIREFEICEKEIYVLIESNNLGCPHVHYL